VRGGGSASGQPLPPAPQEPAAAQARASGDAAAAGVVGGRAQEVLRVLDDPAQVDEAPATVDAKLLDQGIYLVSTSTMDRILGAKGEVRERRRQATHPPAAKPELLATRPTPGGPGTAPSCSARSSGPGSTCR
jgi:putative transposase